MTARVVAVLLAGGTGVRLGAAIPKQLLVIAGKPILAHTLDVFDASAVVDEIIVLMAETHVESAAEIVRNGGYRKVVHVGAGGVTRDGSSRVALALLAARPVDTKVVFHDAVRPLVEHAHIASCVAALERYNAVTVAVPTTDTILQVSQDETIDDIPERSRLRRCQTPQGFRRGLLDFCHQRAVSDPTFEPTDDCGVIRRYAPSEEIAVVEGSDFNIKITRPFDVRIAEQLLRDRTL